MTIRSLLFDLMAMRPLKATWKPHVNLLTVSIAKFASVHAEN